MIKAGKFENRAITYWVNSYLKKNPPLSDSYQI